MGLNAGCCTGMAADFVGVSFCFCAGGEGTGDGLCALVSDLFSGALAALIAFPAVSADLALSIAIVFCNGIIQLMVSLVFCMIVKTI